MIRSFMIIIAFTMVWVLNAQTNPDGPSNPTFNDTFSSGETTKQSKLYSIKFQKQNGVFVYGYIDTFSDRMFSKLDFKGDFSKYSKITPDLVSSVRIKGYTFLKETQDDLSRVYYFPLKFDLRLKDGTAINGIEGRIPEIEDFRLYSAFKEIPIEYFERHIIPLVKEESDRKIFTHYYAKDLKSKSYKLAAFIDIADEKKIRNLFVKYSIGNKFYTMFVRYWTEDSKSFVDNKSRNFNEAPPVNPETVIYFEFD